MAEISPPIPSFFLSLFIYSFKNYIYKHTDEHIERNTRLLYYYQIIEFVLF